MRTLRLTALALSLLVAGCISDNPTGPTLEDRYEFAPSDLKPYLGAAYDVSITYHGVQTPDGSACELEALPFTAPGEEMPFGVEIDMWAHLGVDYVNWNTVLVSQNPDTRAYHPELGWLEINSATGAFTFTNSSHDSYANATHSYQLDGAFEAPGNPQYLSLDGTYTRKDRVRECTVYFSIEGPRIDDLPAF